MRILSRVREFVRKSFLLSIIYYVVDDLRHRLRFAGGNIDTDSGMAHSHGDVQASIRYIEDVFKDYKTYAQVDAFYGRVAEVGPGDNSGVALLFLADGCQSVDLADRFYSKRDPEYHLRVYRALLERHSGLSDRLKINDVSDERDFGPVVRHFGASAAAETFFDTHRGYDFIVSRAVLEHVYDPVVALRGMVAALNAGGMLLHKVDLRDHGMFSPWHHELKYLEVSDTLYPLMAGASGRPNRVLVDRYRAAMIELQLEFRVLVTRLAGVGDITPHVPYEEIDPELRLQSVSYVRSVRGRFAGSLQQTSDQDLGVSGFFLTARKAKGQPGT